MSSDSEFLLAAGSDTFRGFSNLIRRENQKWWTMQHMLSRTALWVVLLDGLLALSLFVFPTLTDPEGRPLFEDNPLQMSSEMFMGIAAIALAIGIIVAMQDTIIEEIQMGTAAWVLSKPVSRTAFIAAKLVASVVGMVLLMILPVALGAYTLFWLYEPGAVSWPNLAGMMAVVTLHTLFYLTLALLIGTLTTRRGVLLGVALGSLLVGGMVPIKALVQISPWQLQQVGLIFLNGLRPGSMEVTMLAATAVWCVVFVVVAVWQFDRIEF